MHPAHARLLRQFDHSHLPEQLAAVVKPFAALARELVTAVDSGADGADTTVALRKLLEAKDAAVRALLP